MSVLVEMVAKLLPCIVFVRAGAMCGGESCGASLCAGKFCGRSEAGWCICHRSVSVKRLEAHPSACMRKPKVRCCDPVVYVVARWVLSGVDA